jgi:formylglycine-generating enzyme required for sulfatase activity
MVQITAADGSSYCIDEREVTFKEYGEFLAAHAGAKPVQSGVCAKNESLEPTLDPGGDQFPPIICDGVYEWPGDTMPNAPVICVDFCDSLAYCAWSGKRLCGVVGKGSTEPSDLTYSDLERLVALEKELKSTESEWFFACSQGATTRYPYGDTYEPGRCIERAEESKDVTQSATRDCHGTRPPYDQVFDLIGSVHEWVNICSGGSCVSPSIPSEGCARSGSASGLVQSTGKGIRCCADTVPED